MTRSPISQTASLFIDRIERALLERDPERHVVSVVYVDLADFRTINAKHGHATGDAVLIEIAQRLHECLRRTDTAARLGGDEFALLLPEVLHPREGELIAQRVVEALAAPIRIDGGELTVSASVGLACANTEVISAALLLRHATNAARDAREAGTGTFGVHGGVASGPADPDLPRELEAALENGEFVVHYQPIVELRTGRILGAEALVRWQHPLRGLVAPLHFLPVAVGMRARRADRGVRPPPRVPAAPALAERLSGDAGARHLRERLGRRARQARARRAGDPLPRGGAGRSRRA